MYTFQDFLEKSVNNVSGFIISAIDEHIGSKLFQTAVTADMYDRQQNKTINEYVKKIYTLSGMPVEDFTASNSKIASNFFRRLNTQRCTYSLGNGITFNDRSTETDANGVVTTVDNTKKKLGISFDTELKKAGYLSLIHGVSFCFWNVDKLYVFPITQFVPLWDEYDGTLRAGIRFWRLGPDKPLSVVLYEEDGYTKYKSVGKNHSKLKVIQEKKKYKTLIQTSATMGEEVIGEENYGSLPIVPLWGSNLHQSTLVGMQQSIDSFDLIRSGFANDLNDCSQIYWLLENCGGMSDVELARFRDRLKVNHIAVVDGDSGAKATPYTQEIPYRARKEYLDHIRAGIYEDFGGLDVHTIAAGATNDHIDAAYQPLDENADDFEYQIIECVQQILKLIGVEDTPNFKRNRISNQKEQVEMVMMEAGYLDDETILSKLPNISPDEIPNILARRNAQDMDRSLNMGNNTDEDDETNGGINEDTGEVFE